MTNPSSLKQVDICSFLGYEKGRPGKNSKDLLKATSAFLRDQSRGIKISGNNKNDPVEARLCAIAFLEEEDRGEKYWPPTADGSLTYEDDSNIITDYLTHIFRLQAKSNQAMKYQQSNKPKRKSIHIYNSRPFVVVESAKKIASTFSTTEDVDTDESCTEVINSSPLESLEPRLSLKPWLEPPKRLDRNAAMQLLEDLDPQKFMGASFGLTKQWLSKKHAEWPTLADEQVQYFMHRNSFYYTVDLESGTDEQIQSLVDILRSTEELDANLLRVFRTRIVERMKYFTQVFINSQFVEVDADGRTKMTGRWRSFWTDRYGRPATNQAPRRQEAIQPRRPGRPRKIRRTSKETDEDDDEIPTRRRVSRIRKSIHSPTVPDFPNLWLRKDSHLDSMAEAALKLVEGEEEKVTNSLGHHGPLGLNASEVIHPSLGGTNRIDSPSTDVASDLIGQAEEISSQVPADIQSESTITVDYPVHLADCSPKSKPNQQDAIPEVEMLVLHDSLQADAPCSSSTQSPSKEPLLTQKGSLSPSRKHITHERELPDLTIHEGHLGHPAPPIVQSTCEIGIAGVRLENPQPAKEVVCDIPMIDTPNNPTTHSSAASPIVTSISDIISEVIAHKTNRNGSTDFDFDTSSQLGNLVGTTRPQESPLSIGDHVPRAPKSTSSLSAFDDEQPIGDSRVLEILSSPTIHGISDQQNPNSPSTAPPTKCASPTSTSATQKHGQIRVVETSANTTNSRPLTPSSRAYTCTDPISGDRFPIPTKFVHDEKTYSYFSKLKYTSMWNEDEGILDMRAVQPAHDPQIQTVENDSLVLRDENPSSAPPDVAEKLQQGGRNQKNTVSKSSVGEKERTEDIRRQYPTENSQSQRQALTETPQAQSQSTFQPQPSRLVQVSNDPPHTLGFQPINRPPKPAGSTEITVSQSPPGYSFPSPTEVNHPPTLPKVAAGGLDHSTPNTSSSPNQTSSGDIFKQLNAFSPTYGMHPSTTNLGQATAQHVPEVSFQIGQLGRPKRRSGGQKRKSQKQQSELSTSKSTPQSVDLSPKETPRPEHASGGIVAPRDNLLMQRLHAAMATTPPLGHQTNNSNNSQRFGCEPEPKSPPDLQQQATLMSQQQAMLTSSAPTSRHFASLLQGPAWLPSQNTEQNAGQHTAHQIGQQSTYMAEQSNPNHSLQYSGEKTGYQAEVPNPHPQQNSQLPSYRAKQRIQQYTGQESTYQAEQQTGHQFGPQNGQRPEQQLGQHRIEESREMPIDPDTINASLGINKHPDELSHNPTVRSAQSPLNQVETTNNAAPIQGPAIASLPSPGQASQFWNSLPNEYGFKKTTPRIRPSPIIHTEKRTPKRPHTPPVPPPAVITGPPPGPPLKVNQNIRQGSKASTARKADQLPPAIPEQRSPVAESSTQGTKSLNQGFVQPSPLPHHTSQMPASLQSHQQSETSLLPHTYHHHTIRIPTTMQPYPQSAAMIQRGQDVNSPIVLSPTRPQNIRRPISPAKPVPPNATLFNNHYDRGDHPTMPVPYSPRDTTLHQTTVTSRYSKDMASPRLGVSNHYSPRDTDVPRLPNQALQQNARQSTEQFSEKSLTESTNQHIATNRPNKRSYSETFQLQPYTIPNPYSPRNISSSITSTASTEPAIQSLIHSMDIPIPNISTINTPRNSTPTPPAPTTLPPMNNLPPTPTSGGHPHFAPSSSSTHYPNYTKPTPISTPTPNPLPAQLPTPTSSQSPTSLSTTTAAGPKLDFYLQRSNLQIDTAHALPHTLIQSLSFSSFLSDFSRLSGHPLERLEAVTFRCMFGEYQRFVVKAGAEEVEWKRVKKRIWRVWEGELRGRGRGMNSGLRGEESDDEEVWEVNVLIGDVS